MPAEPIETKQSDDNHGDGFPQLLHDRSRQAAEELHKLLISLSTGALGVYFLAMTTKNDPPLTPAQMFVVLVGMGSMGISLGAGIFGWLADSRRNYFWASALQQKGRANRAPMFKNRDRWHSVERRATVLLSITFPCGILASIAYVVLRVFNA